MKSGEKNKKKPYCPEIKISTQDKLSKDMNEIKPNNYAQNKQLIFEWTNKKKTLIHYRMLKSYIRLGLVVVQVLEVVSFG